MYRTHKRNTFCITPRSVFSLWTILGTVCNQEIDISKVEAVNYGDTQFNSWEKRSERKDLLYSHKHFKQSKVVFCTSNLYKIEKPEAIHVCKWMGTIQTLTVPNKIEGWRLAPFNTTCVIRVNRSAFVLTTF